MRTKKYKGCMNILKANYVDCVDFTQFARSKYLNIRFIKTVHVPNMNL